MILNCATIYTDTLWFNYVGSVMKKLCRICSLLKDISLFYKRQADCIECWNKKRREENKKSICHHCKIEFRPGVKGRYRFCNDKCRFMSKVEINEYTGCWIWNASKNNKGYGTFAPYGKKSGLAHRESYKLFVEDIPEGFFICHSCDVRECVSPTHLWVGTNQDNVTDKVDKDRQYSKLKNGDVLEIRRLYEKKEIPTSKILELYKISRANLSLIINKKAWKHV